MSCSSVSHRTQWIVINIFQVMKSNVAKFNDLRWWTIISVAAQTENFRSDIDGCVFCFLWVFSTQWKTMLVFIHANGLCGINMLFEINKCPGSLGFIKVRQTFKVHWEERKGKELQPHNCAQVFPLIFCSCKLPELIVHWNFKIYINLLKYQSKDMLFWPLLWTHSFKLCF